MGTTDRWGMPASDLLLAGFFAVLILAVPAFSTGMSVAVLLNWMVLDVAFWSGGVWRAVVSLTVAPGLFFALWLYCRDPYGRGYEHTFMLVLKACALGVPIGVLGWSLRQILRVFGV